MKIKYIRVSSLHQKTDRQETNSDQFDKIFIDKISGTIPFFERPKGKIIMEMIEEGKVEELHIQSVDRLGRDLLSSMKTIEVFNQHSVPIVIQDLGLRTIENGSINHSVQLMFKVLSIFSEMENTIRRERQMEGIQIAKEKGKYKGRKKGSKESVVEFLNKKSHKRAVELLKDGNMSCREVARSVNLHYNTIHKIKRVAII